MSTYSQDGRTMRVETVLGEDVLLLRSFEGEEVVSRPFVFHLDLLSTEAGIKGEDLLRTEMTVFVRLQDGSERTVHGLVSRFRQLGRGTELVGYRAEIVPALWFLSLNRDSRIFQEKSVPDIVSELLDARGVEHRTSLQGDHPPRTYCVQYRESDLDFVSRLLEEEGIFYFFEHTSTGHTLVLADHNAAAPPCPGNSAARVAPGGRRSGEEDVVTAFTVEHRVQPDTASVGAYNFETPSTSLLSTVGEHQREEIYDYPAEHLERGEGERYARIRLEAREARERLGDGAGSCRQLVSGHRFTIKEHFNRNLDGEYLLTEVRHAGDGGEFRSEGRDAPEYRNTFEAIPFDVPFRPTRRTPRPTIRGMQTAVVTGKSGEDIWVDKYGRVKVQFFWDREGKRDENTTCWVRVATTWAGKQWGAIHIPRIGQEVVVAFEEGDPDKPVILGSLWNAEQMPPYDLPDRQAVSGVKSRSTKKGESAHYNEIRFDDTKGKEEIHVHAERNLRTTVELDEVRKVGNDRKTIVKKNDTRSVEEGDDLVFVDEGNRQVTVSEGDRFIWVVKGTDSVWVEGDQDISVFSGNQSIQVLKGDRTIEVRLGKQTTILEAGNLETILKTGNASTKLDLGKITQEAMQGIELKVGPNSIKVDQSGVTISGLTVKLEGKLLTEVKGLMTQVNGDAMLQAKGGITMIN